MALHLRDYSWLPLISSIPCKERYRRTRWYVEGTAAKQWIQVTHYNVVNGGRIKEYKVHLQILRWCKDGKWNIFDCLGCSPFQSHQSGLSSGHILSWSVHVDKGWKKYYVCSNPLSTNTLCTLQFPDCKVITNASWCGKSTPLKYMLEKEIPPSASYFYNDILSSCISLYTWYKCSTLLISSCL